LREEALAAADLEHAPRRNLGQRGDCDVERLPRTLPVDGLARLETLFVRVLRADPLRVV
jgi:hypothetical protein